MNLFPPLRADRDRKREDGELYKLCAQLYLGCGKRSGVRLSLDRLRQHDCGAPLHRGPGAGRRRGGDPAVSDCNNPAWVFCHLFRACRCSGAVFTEAGSTLRWLSCLARCHFFFFSSGRSVDSWEMMSMWSHPITKGNLSRVTAPKEKP